MAERNGSRRTSKGLALERKHQETYEKWWLGKMIVIPNNVDDTPKLVTKVEYIGNSVVGVVKLHFEDGTHQLVGSGARGYRPRKKDVIVK